MKKLGVVAIVVMGLWTVAQSLTIAVSRVFSPAEALFSLMLAAGYMTFGILLIFGRNWLADKWFKDSSNEASIDGVSLLQIGFILFGVFLIIEAIPGIFLMVIGRIAEVNMLNSAISSQSYEVTSDFWTVILPGLVTPIVRLGLGVFLIKSSEYLADRLWYGWNFAERVKDAEELETYTDLPSCSSCGTPYDPADYRLDAVAPECSNCGNILDLGSNL